MAEKRTVPKVLHCVQTTASGLILGEVDAQQAALYEHCFQFETLPDDLRTEDGIPRYMVVDGVVVLRPDADVEADVVAYHQHMQEMASIPTEAERIANLEKENRRLRAENEALTETVDFHEELIVELATVLYA